MNSGTEGKEHGPFEGTVSVYISKN